MSDTSARRFPQIGIIIPACDEAPAIAQVLEELLREADPETFVISVGVNGSSDATAEIARRYPVLVAETAERGYGFGCQAAIERLETVLPPVHAYVFFAADGATDPRDVRSLLAAFDMGHDFVLAARTTSFANWPVMKFSHVIANLLLGAWCGFLARRWFSDLAPLRLIERELFRAIDPREFTFGWTIEAQIAAAKLGARICEVKGRERPRLAGEQKVSGVTWRRTFFIGCRIFVAGFRTWRRFGSSTSRATTTSETPIRGFVHYPQRGS